VALSDIQNYHSEYKEIETDINFYPRVEREKEVFIFVINV
jgi:hypothetical protein